MTDVSYDTNIGSLIVKQPEFLAWLEVQPRGAVVGRACIACDCPLTRWFASQGLCVTVLSTKMIFIGRVIELPEWAAWFTLTVDILGTGKDCRREEMITIVKGIKIDEKKKATSRSQSTHQGIQKGSRSHE